MQKRTNYITIPMEEYERLAKAEAYLQAVINSPSYNMQATAEAIKAALGNSERDAEGSGLL